MASDNVPLGYQSKWKVTTYLLRIGDIKGAIAALLFHTPPKPLFKCTRCGRNEFSARFEGCTKGPCPMEDLREHKRP